MSSGRPFNSDVRFLLLLTAKYLVEANTNSRKIKNKFCEGVVRTEGKHASIGTIAGQLFEADLEIASGRTTVHYLVRTSDLDAIDPDRDEWTDWMGPLEFEETFLENHYPHSLS